MKKNLTKLALSGAALAAVAATLGTSTYAWYTTNPTVNANNIVGESSDSGSSSIFISKDQGNNKSWSQTVTFTGTEFTTKLNPVQPTANAGAFTTLAGGDSSDFINVKLYFKTSKTADDVSLYVKDIKIYNPARTTLPAVDNLLAGTTTYSASDYGVANTSGTYSVDFVRALGMQITDGTTKQSFSLAGYNSYTSGNTTTTDFATGTNTVTVGKAHAYYNAVMPEDKALAGGDITTGKALTAASVATETAIATLPAAGTAVEVNFYIYLNGWNDFCYDACQGQSFVLNMSFTSDVESAL